MTLETARHLGCEVFFFATAELAEGFAGRFTEATGREATVFVVPGFTEHCATFHCVACAPRPRPKVTVIT